MNEFLSYCALDYFSVFSTFFIPVISSSLIPILSYLLFFFSCFYSILISFRLTFCCSVPYRISTSMFPVSGAEQLKTYNKHMKQSSIQTVIQNCSRAMRRSGYIHDTYIVIRSPQHSEKTRYWSLCFARLEQD
jgi:hypothetical protein